VLLCLLLLLLLLASLLLHLLLLPLTDAADWQPIKATHCMMVSLFRTLVQLLLMLYFRWEPWLLLLLPPTACQLQDTVSIAFAASTHFSAVLMCHWQHPKRLLHLFVGASSYPGTLHSMLESQVPKTKLCCRMLWKDRS